MTHLQSKSCAINADHKLKTFNLENIEQSKFKTRFHFKIENYFKNFAFFIKNNNNNFEL